MSKIITIVIDEVLHWLNFVIPKRELGFVQDLCIFTDHKSLLRYIFLQNLGVKEFETGGIQLHGALDSLKASNIVSGPFKIELTNNPKEHLTFDSGAKRTVLRILSPEKIFSFYVFQRVGLTRYSLCFKDY